MSTTITGIFGSFLFWLLSVSGFQIVQGDIDSFIKVGGFLLSIIIAYIGRIRLKDLNLWGTRKKIINQ